MKIGLVVLELHHMPTGGHGEANERIIKPLKFSGNYMHRRV
jgi:hypothetical protein